MRRRPSDEADEADHFDCRLQIADRRLSECRDGSGASAAEGVSGGQQLSRAAQAEVPTRAPFGSVDMSVFGGVAVSGFDTQLASGFVQQFVD